MAGVQHIDLVVSSIERSLPFYRELLAPLGYHRIQRSRASAARRSGTSRAPASRSACARPNPRARTTATRWASTTSRSRRGRAPRSTSAPSGCVERGAEIESGPEEYAYQPGYYAVFFYDPDGIKLEIVHIPDQAA